MTEMIKTARLTLRKLQKNDAPRVALLIGDLSVSRWLTRVPHPYGVQDAETFIQTASLSETGEFTVTLDDEIIGGCSVNEQLGYWYGRAYWGNGFATEAARAILGWYFSRHRETILSGYIFGNAASQNVLEKLGFQPGEVRQQNCMALNETVAVQKMRLTQSAWRTLA